MIKEFLIAQFIGFLIALSVGVVLMLTILLIYDVMKK